MRPENWKDLLKCRVFVVFWTKRCGTCQPRPQLLLQVVHLSHLSTARCHPNAFQTSLTNIHKLYPFIKVLQYIIPTVKVSFNRSARLGPLRKLAVNGVRWLAGFRFVPGSWRRSRAERHSNWVQLLLVPSMLVMLVMLVFLQLDTCTSNSETLKFFEVFWNLFKLFNFTTLQSFLDTFNVAPVRASAQLPPTWGPTFCARPQPFLSFHKGFWQPSNRSHMDASAFAQSVASCLCKLFVMMKKLIQPTAIFRLRTFHSKKSFQAAFGTF